MQDLQKKDGRLFTTHSFTNSGLNNRAVSRKYLVKSLDHPPRHESLRTLCQIPDNSKFSIITTRVWAFKWVNLAASAKNNLIT